MKAILPHFFEFLNSKMPEYIGVLEELAIQKSGSKEKLKKELAARIQNDGETKAFLDVLMPIREWQENDLVHIESIEEMQGFNDFIDGIVSTDLGKVIIDFEGISKTVNPLGIALTTIGVFEWLDTKVMSMDSLEYDIDMSKNTRRTWLNFFFENPIYDSNKSQKEYRYYNVRKITPRDYVEIWIKFVLVDISNFKPKIKRTVKALRNGWVVSKEDLKKAYNKRPEHIKAALLDAVDQPDYPDSWPKVIPDKDKYPYSVSLFIARELSIS